MTKIPTSGGTSVPLIVDSPIGVIRVHTPQMRPLTSTNTSRATVIVEVQAEYAEPGLVAAAFLPVLSTTPTPTMTPKSSTEVAGSAADRGGDAELVRVMPAVAWMARMNPNSSLGLRVEDTADGEWSHVVARTCASTAMVARMSRLDLVRDIFGTLEVEYILVAVVD